MRWSGDAVAAGSVAASAAIAVVAPAVVVALFAVAAGAGCRPDVAPLPVPAHTAPARSCPRVDPACAPVTDAPVTDDDAMAIVKRRCWRCHDPGGLAGHDFPDLAHLRAAPIADRLSTCAMPPNGAPLPDDERAVLIRWARCTEPSP